MLVDNPNRYEVVQSPELSETIVGAVGATASAEVVVDTTAIEPAPELLDAHPQPRTDTLESIAAQRPQLLSPEERLATAVMRYGGGGSTQAIRTRQQRNARLVDLGHESFSSVRRMLGYYPQGFRRS